MHTATRPVILIAVAACGGDPDLDAPPTTDVGHVELAQVRGAYSHAEAYFGPPPKFSIEDVGPCRIRVGAFGSALVGAGSVTLSSAATEDFEIPMLSGGNYGLLFDGDRYAVGETVAVTATGDVVPAFSGSLVIPSLTLISREPTLRRNSEYVASWEPTDTPVVIQIEQRTTNLQNQTIRCNYAGAAGTGAIPVEALKVLALDQNAQLMIQTEMVEALTAGVYAVTLSAITRPYYEDLVVQF